MTTMYCPNCKMNVSTSRDDLNIPLAILLGIFTGGIGLLIYLAIWYPKDDRCIHCKSVCEPLSNNQSGSNYQIKDQSYQGLEYTPSEQKPSIDVKAKFCYNCGSQIADRESAKYCPYCGAGTD